MYLYIICIYIYKYIVVLPSVHLHKACPDKAGCRHTGATSEPDSPSPAGQWEHAEKEDNQKKSWAPFNAQGFAINPPSKEVGPSGSGRETCYGVGRRRSASFL